MKQFKHLFFAGILLFGLLQQLNAQTAANTTAPKVYHIGIFAPLYLDSLFNDAGYKYGKTIPKNFMPGIDFVQGAMIALDSMMLWDAYLDAGVFDTKSYTQNIGYLIRNKKLDSLDLIIGSVKDMELKQLADFALQKNIPFISVTHPNDAGITANPFTVIMTSTLKAHCEAIYSYLLQNHATEKSRIVLVRQPGAQEDRVAGYFKTLNEQEGKPFLNIQTLQADSNFTSATLMNKLDSSLDNVIIGGSLDENFASNITKQCYALYDKYDKMTLIGMPNWDGFASLRKKDAFKDFPIYYTTPYFNNKWDSYSKMLIGGYHKKYRTRPSDMAFKGFESTYFFTKLLMRHPQDFISALNDKAYKVITDYNFKPVMLKKSATLPDYFENKHLYFIKILNGATAKAW
jgi:Periplasmic binding protein